MESTPFLSGIGASTGIVEGAVCIVVGATDESRFQEGDILVTKITDPTMVSMMSRAAAIVCDIGGITSHPSIISRELGIPCVVRTNDGTVRLKDGMRIRVDGGSGNIYVV